MNLTQRTDAYRAALALLPNAKDRRLPAELDRLATLRRDLWAVPTGDGGLGQIITDPGAGSFEDALAAVAAEMNRRQAAEAAIRGGAGRLLEQAYGAALREFLPTLVERVAPVFAEAAQALTDAAPHLPAGDAWADPAAVLRAQVEGQHRAALVALDTLDTLGAVHKIAPGGLRGTAVLAVVEPPANLAPVVILPVTRKPADAAAANRARVARSLLVAYATDPRGTLVGVAQGAYPGCTLALARDAGHLAARVEAVEDAHATRTQKPAELKRRPNPTSDEARKIVDRHLTETANR